VDSDFIDLELEAREQTPKNEENKNANFSS
jgi:hypothetical protein